MGEAINRQLLLSSPLVTSFTRYCGFRKDLRDHTVCHVRHKVNKDLSVPKSQIQSKNDTKSMLRLEDNNHLAYMCQDLKLPAIGFQIIDGVKICVVPKSR